MNLVFRLVRRKSDGRLIVASELAKRSAKGMGSIMALVAAFAFAQMSRASEIVGDSGANGATVDTSYTATQETGTPVLGTADSAGRRAITDITDIVQTSVTLTAPVVEINAPNASGISHNTYTKFNVDSDNVLLNNVTGLLPGGYKDGATLIGAQTTSANVQSASTDSVVISLGANDNLNSAASGATAVWGAASVIINEVTNSAHASTLAGKIEVVGAAADVIIANPYGISCTGCTFINSANATLATGSVTTSGDDVTFALSDSALTVNAYSATDGDGNTSVTSLSATNLAMISRQIKILGQVEAETLQVIAHNGEAVLDTGDNTVTTNATGASTNTAPLFAIDSAALGGMYANTISLIATEAGVGVRTRGDMAALGDAISISADGKLTIGDVASDSTELDAQTITLTSASGEIELNTANLTASGETVADAGNTGGSIAITADGAVNIIKGSLSAGQADTNTNVAVTTLVGGNITITGASLTDNTVHANAGEAHVRKAFGDLTINTTGAIDIAASSYSGATLDLDAASLNLASTAALGSTVAGDIDTTGDITIAGTLATGTGTATIDTSAGDISVAATAAVTATGLSIDASGDITLTSGAAFATQGALSLIASTLAIDSDLSVIGNLTLGDAGTTALTLGANNATALTSVSANLLAQAGTLTWNSDAAIGGTSGLGVAGNALTIGSTANFSGAFTTTLTGASLDLDGVIAQTGNIAGTFSGAVDIAQTGALSTLGGTDISINASSLNNRGDIISSGDLSLGDGAANSSLANTGTLKAADDLTINVTGLVYNQAALDSSDSSAADGRNLGKLYDSGTSASTDTFEDRVAINAGQIGAISSTAGNLTITAANLINEGSLAASGTLDLTGTVLRNQLATIWNGTTHAGDSRGDLMSTRSQYEYVNQGGIESYIEDEYLTLGRASFTPTVIASSLTLGSGANFSIGGTVSAASQTGALTEVNLSPNRTLTTIASDVVAPTVDADVPTTGPVTIVADGTTDTSVELASNERTYVVNIAPPNAVGLSNNQYSQFDVNTHGAILNNMPFGQSVTAETELSAVITANASLTDAATVILNQVFSGPVSKLNGFVEVAGNTADVLIVNPAGIYCDSCGAINADRFDYVVGSVSLTGGEVSTFSSAGATGTFNLLAQGMDSRTPAWTSIIAPEATIDGTLNAQNLFVGLGAGTFTRGATTGTAYSRSASATQTNTEALLVTEPAGIFADTLTIDSNSSNQNARVRILGELAANAGDLTLNANGNLSLYGRLSASRDLSLTTTSSTDNENIAVADIQLVNGALTSGRDLLMTANAGSMVFNGGQIYSFGDATFDALTLVDDATSNVAQFNNSRYAGDVLTLDVDNVLRITGTTWDADTIAVDGYGTLAMTTGLNAMLTASTLLNLDVDTLSHSGTLAAPAIDLDAATSARNESAGTLRAVERSSLTTPSFTNAGNWVATASDTATGAAIMDVDSLTNQAGATLSSADTLTLSGAVNAGTVLVNAGTLTSNSNMDATLVSLSNSGDLTVSLRASDQASTWTVNSLSNQAGATLFAGYDWLVNAAGVDTASARGTSLSNSGQLQGYRNLTLAFDSLTLPAGTQLNGALGATAGDTFNLALTNAHALDALIFSGANLSSRFDGGITVNPDGALAATGDLTAATTDLVNYGLIYAGQDMDLDASNKLGNLAKVSLTNGRGFGYSAVDGSYYREQNQVLLSQGDIRSGGDMTLDGGTTLVNSSEIRAGGDLTVTATTISNQPLRTSSAGFATDTPMAHTTNRRINYSRTVNSVGNYVYPDQYETKTTSIHWEEFNYYKDGAPAVTPVMKATGQFALSGTTIQNYGGLIQAEGAGANSINATGALTNDALALIREDWNGTIVNEIKYAALGPAKYYDRQSGGNPTGGADATLDTGDAVVTTVGSLELHGKNLTNVGALAPADGGHSYAADSALNPNGFSLTVTLPSSPNGFFVTNRDPSAAYLVEMNPKLQAGVSTLGSDYLLSNLSVNSDLTTQRLGDASYEAYLVEQQLIQANGAGVLDGYDTIADVMRGFMDNAGSQASTLGLTLGVAPTDEQLANLDEPIVWMVETTVQGQKVLAPQVYLPKRIRDEIASKSAVISAGKDLNVDVASLDNLGGDITAGDALTIEAEGDINNISGRIAGTDVSVTSTEGTITNETFNEFSGNDVRGETRVGRTASIEASGNLNLDAAGDIVNRGATVSAGENATLNAGGDIVFDTIERTTNTFDAASDGTTMTLSRSSTTEQIRSGLSVGGDLSSTSGGDTTFAGTNVSVGGDADVQSGGDINIIARENVATTSVSSFSGGVGVGGGAWGTEKKTTDTLTIRNQGSTFDVGGDASFSGEGDMVVQGSEVNVDGNADIDTNSLTVLQGRDVDQTTEKTETFTVGVTVEKIENVDGSESTGVGFAQAKISERETLSSRAVGSALNIGGNLDVDVDEDVVLQGSEINADGNVDIDAENITLLAAQNIERETTSDTTVKFGLYASTDTESDTDTTLSAGTDTNASTGGTSTALTAKAGASADARAGASASGSASATVDFAIGRTDTSLALDITNTGSAIRSGGNLNLDAEQDITLVGSELEAEGDVDLNATNITAVAARDVSVRETSAESVRIGIYADAGGSAEANAQAGASATAQGGAGLTGTQTKANAKAGAEAGAETEGKAGVGLQTQVAKLTERDTETTAQVSAIRSRSGSVSRTATDSITDVGTEIEAAENFTQSADTINSFAARNESISETSYSEVTAKIGVYAEAEGEAKASAGASADADLKKGPSAQVGAQASAEAGARVGIELQVDTLNQTETLRETEAVASNIRVGGNVESTSAGTSTFEGTQIEADGDISVSGEDINITAARNTSERTFDEVATSTRTAVAVGVGGSAKAGASANSKGKTEAGAEAEGGVKVRVEVETSIDVSNETETATEAVVASFNAGGDVNLNADNDINIEGADIEAGDAINVDARELNVTAAADTETSTASSTSVEFELMVEATIIGSTGVEGEGSVDVNVANESAQSSEAVTGSLSSSQLNIRTREDANFEGTQVTATEGATLDVGGDLNVTAAANTSSAAEDEVSVSVSIEASSGGDFGAEVGVGVSNADEQSSEAVVSTFNVGTLDITTGGDANFEGTEIDASGDAALDIGGDLNFTAARNTESANSQSIEVEVGIGTTDSKEDDGSSESSGEFSLGVDVEVSQSDANEAVTGSLLSGGNLSITTGGSQTFEGTELGADEGVDIDAGGAVTFNEAVSTSNSLDVGVSVGIGASSSTETDGESGDATTTNKQSGSAGLNLGLASSRQGEGASVSGGNGGVTIRSGGDVTLVGTELDANTELDAEGNVIRRDLTDESSGFETEFSVKAENTSKSTVKGTKADDAEAPKADQPTAETQDAKPAGSDQADGDSPTDDGDDQQAKPSDDGEAKADDSAEKKPDAKEEEEESEAPEIKFLDKQSADLKKKRDKQDAAKAKAEAAANVEAPEPIAAPEWNEDAVRSMNGNAAVVPGLSDLDSLDEVVMADSTGQSLPDWIKLDLATGEVQATPPDGFAGQQDVSIALPNGESFFFRVGQ